MISNKYGTPPKLNTLEDFYGEISKKKTLIKKAKLILELRDWFIAVYCPDNRDGSGLPMSISEFTQAIDNYATGDPLKDRLWRISKHSEDAIKVIVNNLKTKVQREYKILPIYAVRKVDSVSILWLSKKTGRNIREKLAGKPYLKALKRRMSTDTTENRLLKDYLLKLERYLLLRFDTFEIDSDNEESEVYIQIRKWFKSNEFSEILPWTNLPPNNTLLQNRNYRKVWDAWLWLQRLDEDLQRDRDIFLDDLQTVLYWTIVSKLKQIEIIRIPEQPLLFNYDNFKIDALVKIKGIIYSRKLLNQLCEIQIDKHTEYIELITNRKKIIIQINWNEKDKKIQLFIEDRMFEYGPTIASLTSIAEKIISDSMNGGKKAESKVDIQNTNDRKWAGSDLIIDISSIQPTFSYNHQTKILPFRLLFQIWETSKKEQITLDLGNSNAIVLNQENETISIFNILSPSDNKKNSDKKNVMLKIARNLSEYFKSINQFTYLIPDIVDDFSLSNVRMSINFYLHDAQPLPKSIASVFAMQSSNYFSQTKFNSRDCILVIDKISDRITLTPIIVKKSNTKIINDKLPEIKGIVWDRHPTFSINIKNDLNRTKENLTKFGCEFSEELLKLLDCNGLSDVSDNVTFSDKNYNWFTPSKNPKETLISNSNVEWGDITNLIKNIKIKSIYIINIDNSSKLKIRNLPTNVKYINLQTPLVHGGEILNKWQSKVPNIPLWRDHLPELAIKIIQHGHYEKFYLVKDTTIIPQKGKSVKIQVKEKFTLPKGQGSYIFPLYQGDLDNMIKYSAKLRSKAFPLQNDTVCKLDMTYTYGADDPYDLEFIPMNKKHANFKSVKAEWSSIEVNKKINLSKLPIPSFPTRKTWSDFQKFPRDKGKEYSNLLEWVEREIHKIQCIRRFGRITNSSIGEWKIDKKGNKYCFADNTLLHQKAFILKSKDNLPEYGKLVSYYKMENYGKFFGLDISLVDEEPYRCFLSKSMRFPVITIWNNGHSLSESDVPDNFRNSVFDGIKAALSIIETKDVPNSLKEELFFFLSCLHKDAPVEVAERLVKASQKKQTLRKYYRNIAFAIGDAELDWQQELLENVLDPVDNQGLTRSITMEILAVAFWRSQDLILYLSSEQIEIIINNLYRCIKVDYEKLIIRRNIKQMGPMCKHLELLLALLRTRIMDYDFIKKLLSPDREITIRYISMLDDISKFFLDNDFELKSRISIQIDKPPMFHDTPDLLYALRMYLTGDSGANSIQITVINDE